MVVTIAYLQNLIASGLTFFYIGLAGLGHLRVVYIFRTVYHLNQTRLYIKPC